MYFNGVFKINNNLNTDSLQSIVDKMGRFCPTESSRSVGNSNAFITFSGDSSSHYFSDDKLGVCVFVNGNIYNFEDIRIKLTSQSKSNISSVAELIVYGYARYGKEIVNMLDGEFILCIINNNINTVLLARDCVGTIPLYYYNNDNYFVFSSSLKNIVYSGLVEKNIDEAALSQYLQLTYIPAPKTIIKNVSKMLPASTLEIHENGNQVSQCYWDVNLSAINTDYNDCKKQLNQALTNAVSKRINIEGRAGAFLSGGFDSTIIVGLMSKLSEEQVDTFTIGFNDKSFIDETPLSKIVADKNNTNHHTILLDWNLAETAISKILKELDEPFADSSLISTYMVCKKTSEHCDYALTGDAGDELFAGYNKYLINYYNQRIRKIPKSIRNYVIRPISKLFPYKTGITRSVNKVLSVCDMDIYEQRKSLMMLGFKPNELEKLLTKPEIDSLDFVKELYERFPNADEQTRTQYVDLKVVIDGCMLPKVRNAAQLAGFKTIAPMLDAEVVKLAFSMPSEFKIKKKKRKIILKDTFSEHIPDELFKAPKNGFGVPIQNWLRYNLKERLYEVSETEFLETQGLFNSDYIHQIIDNHISGKEDRFSELWAFLVFQSWYKTFVLGDD